MKDSKDLYSQNAGYNFILNSNENKNEYKQSLFGYRYFIYYHKLLLIQFLSKSASLK